MVTPRLSDLIRSAVAEAPPPGLSARVLALRARLLSDIGAGRHSRSSRDALLRELVLLYQNGPARLWSPLLLEAMGPALSERLKRFTPPGPAIDADDIAQQLVVALLEVAGTVYLADDADCVEKQLLKEAARRVSRGLRHEYQRQLLMEALLADDEGEEEVDEELAGKQERERRRPDALLAPGPEEILFGDHEDDCCAEKRQTPIDADRGPAYASAAARLREGCGDWD